MASFSYISIVNIYVMNEFEQYQYAEMMRQSRNSALYYMMLHTKQRNASGNGKKELPVPPEPPVQLSTYMEFDDGTSQWFDFSGEITLQTMIDTGLFDLDNYGWIKNPIKVEIGSKVISIGIYAFNNCSKLASIEIPNSVTSIGNDAFSYSGLISVTIPNSVSSIGDYAFNYSDLTSIEIPNSVSSIGEKAFSYSGLTSIIIPNSINSIKNDTFNGCNKLTSIEIPNSVTSIGDYAFSYSDLTSIEIPNSVSSIGVYAFNGCSKLTLVTIEGKSKATVQNMDNYPWELTSGCTISGTDPDTGESWNIIV